MRNNKTQDKPPQDARAGSVGRVARTGLAMVLAAAHLLFAPAGALAADAQPYGQPPLELFKAFVERPPIVAELTYRLELWGAAGAKGLELTNYFRVRYQPDAMFMGLNTETLPPSEPSWDVYNRVVSRFKNNYWYRYYTDLYVWTNHDVPEERDGTVDAQYQRAIYTDLPRVLNMSCYDAPVASIKWAGDSFTVTNRATGFVVHGRLSADAAGRAKSLTVRKSRVGSAVRAGQESVVSCEYAYEDPVPVPYLPSVITIYPRANGPANQPGIVCRLRLLTLQFGQAPLPERSFSLFPYHGTAVQNTFSVSNRFLVYSEKAHLRKVADDQHIPNRKAVWVPSRRWQRRAAPSRSRPHGAFSRAASPVPRTWRRTSMAIWRSAIWPPSGMFGRPRERKSWLRFSDPEKP